MLINLYQVARLWNAIGTYKSPFQNKANSVLLFSASKSGHEKQTEIVQDLGLFWKFGPLMRVSQDSI